MQPGAGCCATNGVDHGVAGSGELNLCGGDCANGIPRYALAVAVDAGEFVALNVVPIITPSGIVAVGLSARTVAPSRTRRRMFAESAILMLITSTEGR